MAYKFINPYNFIPFDNRTKAKITSAAGDTKYSGCIEYSVKTKTPLIILNTSNDDIFGLKSDDKPNEKHKSYEFFSYEDLSKVEASAEGKIPTEPVIPGSEIRGMFRSNYEIITDSCLSFTETDKILHKRVSGFFEAGFVKKDGDKYSVVKAGDCILRTVRENCLEVDEKYKNKDVKSYKQKDLEEGQKIYVKVQTRDKGKPLIADVKLEKTQEYREGYIIMGEAGPKKHCAHVFLPKENDKVGVDFSNLKVDKIVDEALAVYDDNNKGAYKKYREAWDRFKKSKTSDLFPVYYIVRDGKIYLSPASGTMEIYNKDCLENSLGKKLMCKGNDLCPACAIFGMLDNSGNGMSSKLRFTDLRVDGISGDFFERKITLQELSSPKLQNVEFYLKKPSKDAQFWTYDYWVDTSGKVHQYTPELNGRKFYWHSSKVAEAAKVKTERNITTRPLKSGIRFGGKVFFDDVTEKELSQLIWLINCGECGDIDTKKHGYKLGHAKPLGYGSIRVAVDSVKIRTVEFEDDVVSVNYKDCTDEMVDKSVTAFDDSKIKNNFEIMTSFNYVEEHAPGYTIGYPIVKEDGPVYEWFVGNHIKHNKKNGVWEKGMQTGVEEMAFGEYMEPMEPVLKNLHKSKIKQGEENHNVSNRNNHSQNKTYHNNGKSNYRGNKTYKK